jgi:hypothetical protein
MKINDRANPIVESKESLAIRHRALHGRMMPILAPVDIMAVDACSPRRRRLKIGGPQLSAKHPTDAQQPESDWRNP